MKRGRPPRLGERLRTFDRWVETFARHRRSPTLDRVFYPLSSAADHSLLWLALGALREATGRGASGSTLRLGAVLAAESALTNGALKLAFRRLRPELDAAFGVPLPFALRRPVTSAFPSGHATAAFTAAAFLSRGDRLAPVYYTLAGAVAASRVYVCLHHASDVVAGAGLGLVFGAVARRLAPVREFSVPGDGCRLETREREETP